MFEGSFYVPALNEMRELIRDLDNHLGHRRWAMASRDLEALEGSVAQLRRALEVLAGAME